MGCAIKKTQTPEFVPTPDIQQLMKKFCMKHQEMHKMWVIFHKIDSNNNSGTVSVIEIFKLIKEKPNSVIAPYLIQYIDDLEKESGERLSFVEFVRSIAKYCLLTPTQILKCKL